MLGSARTLVGTEDNLETCTRFVVIDAFKAKGE
jgi:hypothetical protein